MRLRQNYKRFTLRELAFSYSQELFIILILLWFNVTRSPQVLPLQGFLACLKSELTSPFCFLNTILSQNGAQHNNYANSAPWGRHLSAIRSL